jgi:hypothetical protein
MLPLAGSLAIDDGHNVYNRSFDQRGPGFQRVLGAAPDIGAVESTDEPDDVMFAKASIEAGDLLAVRSFSLPTGAFGRICGGPDVFRCRTANCRRFASASCG